jgi:hypothetical protein
LPEGKEAHTRNEFTVVERVVPTARLSVTGSNRSDKGENMPEEQSLLRPEDIVVETFSQLSPGFHVVDEDPADPASGYDFSIPNPWGTITNV